MCNLRFMKVSGVLCWGEGVINTVHENNPKTTKIIDKELYAREDVLSLICPEIAQMSKGDILRRKLLESNTKKEKK